MLNEWDTIRLWRAMRALDKLVAGESGKRDEEEVPAAEDGIPLLPGEVTPNEHAISAIPWMEMELQTPYLRIPKNAKGVNCTDSGAVFRAPHRLPTDQKVFRQNRGRRSGSVLIDGSGSMQLDKEAIQKIVTAVPAAVIAVYGGYSPCSGALRVVAKMGRLVVHEKEYAPVGMANGVDGPALRWLGMQPLPRIWVSDGEVTGVGDGQTEELYAQAAAICERYRIRRVGELNKVLRLL